MKLIAAVDEHWAIGYKGKLLARISEDQRFFKQTTMGHVVVYGRKTLEEFPHGRPLTGRTNIILSRRQDYKVENAQVVHSVSELMERVLTYDKDEVFVIGGESVYKALYPYCSAAIITRILKTYDADAFLPDMDALADWELVKKSDVRHADTSDFYFSLYKNHNPAVFE